MNDSPLLWHRDAQNNHRRGHQNTKCQCELESLDHQRQFLEECRVGSLLIRTTPARSKEC